MSVTPPQQPNIDPSTYPSSVFVAKFNLSTLDANNNLFLESGYNITPPIVNGTTTLTRLPQFSYNKFIIPIDNQNPAFYVLKFWLPNPTSGGRDVYMTYGTKAPSLVDGYRDIISSSDSSYPGFRNALRNWIRPVNDNPGFTYSKTISFTFIGADTNQTQNTATATITLVAPPDVQQGNNNPGGN